MALFNWSSAAALCMPTLAKIPENTKPVQPTIKPAQAGTIQNMPLRQYSHDKA